MALVSIQQAAANALQAYLASKLTGVSVEQRWPDPHKRLPSKAVTILLSGRRRERAIDSRMINATNVGGAQSTSTWQFAFCEQDLQIDIWAVHDVDRDDLIAQLDNLLNAGQSVISTNADPVAEGVVLQLADGWTANGTTTYVDFLFEGPNITDAPDAVQSSEFRGTIRGTASAMLTATATTARQAQIVFEQMLYDQAQSASYDKTTITSSGTTYSTGPE